MAVCTWDGDVWLVRDSGGTAREITWKRIASGLFQPLGLKIVEGQIYVGCRDQIVRLHDLNGDEEIVHMLCDEAQLPNVQTATGQLSGRFLG